MLERGGAVSVLLADDNAAVLEALEEVLLLDTSLEHVASACDAEQAIELAVRHRPDVALIDVRMPAGGGVRATREICERSPGTAVVAHSAADDRASVLAMLESGALGYLVKGSDVTELVNTIKRSALHQPSVSAEVTCHIVDELARKLRGEGAETAELRALTERIERTLERGGFEIAFQPIVALDSGKVAGYEALSRFKVEPDQAPDRWFADADRVGLRTELELAAIRRALLELPHLEPDVFLSLNVSPSTLLGGSLDALIPRAVRPRVVLEVTEHAPIASYDALASSLASLRGDGVRLAVDDAGAGFASLRHILKLEPDLIKIDQSLTKNIEHDPRVRALAAAIITFARETGVAVVGEGIETTSQLDELQALGATSAQGYLLGRPARRPRLTFLDTAADGRTDADR